MYLNQYRKSYIDSEHMRIHSSAFENKFTMIFNKAPFSCCLLHLEVSKRTYMDTYMYISPKLKILIKYISFLCLSGN